MKLSIRTLYLYLFSFVGLLIVVFGSISLIDLGIKTFIFPDADRYDIYYESQPKMEGVEQPTKEELEARQAKESTRQKQRQLSNSIAMILVGTPLYLYHWRTLQKEDK